VPGRARRHVREALTTRVAIVGGSLGGLTAGVLLRDAGFDVTVYERSPAELQERGAGIGFLPASSRYLVERAGIDLDDISVATHHIRYLDRAGNVVHDAPHAYRFSSWNTVYRRLLGCFDREQYSLGHEMRAFSDDGDGVTIRFGNGATAVVDLLVAADGVGSTARAALLPDTAPRYAGYVAWRGTVPEAGLDAGVAQALGGAITYHVGANTHLLVYPIPAAGGEVDPGRRLVNLVWYRNYAAGPDLADLLTDTAGLPHELSLPPGTVRPEHVAEMRAVAVARLPPLLAEVVMAVERPFVQVIYDLEVPRMAFGRVCLIGDAAFAVRPHAAAGTAKAAADAWALAGALAAGGTVEDSLARWEPGQLALGRQLLQRTRRIGTRSQITGDWQPGDPELIFGLYEPGR
jgi:2,6-dihydroxypyridine 3-monooxygenase